MKRANISRDEAQALILAIETSGRQGSVALAQDSQFLAQAVFSAPMRHSAEIFPSIAALLQRFGCQSTDVQQIYISVGPGSFTGLRIAVTIAKMMNFAADVKIVAVDTLDVIAANATDFLNESDEKISQIATILDAKRGQFYVATYEDKDSQWQKTLPDSVITPAQLLEHFGDAEPSVWLLGEGLVYYKDKFKADNTRFIPEDYWHPKAEKVYCLGYEKALKNEFADALALQPAYLRRPEAKEKSSYSK